MLRFRLFSALFAALLMWQAQPLLGCNTPTTVSLASRTTTSITISYSASGTHHQIEYGTLGFALGNGTRSAWVTSPTFAATGLEPSTGYRFLRAG